MFKPTAANWAKAKELGRAPYIVHYGVVGWGVPVAVVYSLLEAVTDGWSAFVPTLGVSLILFPVVGFFVGLFAWKQMERDYSHADAVATNSRN